MDFPKDAATPKQKLYIPIPHKSQKPLDFPESRSYKKGDYLSYMTLQNVSHYEGNPGSVFSDQLTAEMNNSLVFQRDFLDARQAWTQPDQVQISDSLFNNRLSLNKLAEPSTWDSQKQSLPRPLHYPESKARANKLMEPTEEDSESNFLKREMQKIVPKQEHGDPILGKEGPGNEQARAKEQSRVREKEKYLRALEIAGKLQTSRLTLTEINKLVYSFGNNYLVMRGQLFPEQGRARQSVFDEVPPYQDKTLKLGFLKRLLKERMEQTKKEDAPGFQQNSNLLLKRGDEEANIKFEEKDLFPLSRDFYSQSKPTKKLQVIQEEDRSVKMETYDVKDEAPGSREQAGPGGSFRESDINNLIQFMLQKNRQQINIKTLNANIRTINNFGAGGNVCDHSELNSKEMEQLKPLMNDIRNYYMDPKSKSFFLKITASESEAEENSSQYLNLVSVDKLIKSKDPGDAPYQLPKLDFLNLRSLFAKKEEPPPEMFIKFPQQEKKVDKSVCKAKCKKKKRSTSKKGKRPKRPRRGEKKTAGCKCSKSKCLRLHCICFRNKQFCDESCKCTGCYNKTQFKHLVEEVRKVTKEINSEAFESRFVTIENQGQVFKYTKGCSCSKNNCLKNYCECRKNGLPCTPLCKCEGCKNHKIDIAPELAKKLCRRKSRKKKKIVFKAENNKKLDFTQQLLSSKAQK